MGDNYFMVTSEEDTTSASKQLKTSAQESIEEIQEWQRDNKWEDFKTRESIWENDFFNIIAVLGFSIITAIGITAIAALIFLFITKL